MQPSLQAKLPLAHNADVKGVFQRTRLRWISGLNSDISSSDVCGVGRGRNTGPGQRSEAVTGLTLQSSKFFFMLFTGNFSVRKNGVSMWHNPHASHQTPRCHRECPLFFLGRLSRSNFKHPPKDPSLPSWRLLTGLHGPSTSGHRRELAGLARAVRGP